MKKFLLSYGFSLSILLLLNVNLVQSQTVEPDLSVLKTVKPIQPQNPSIPLIDYIRRLPGVLVMQRGGETKIQLRGSTSLLGDSEPLYIVDGRYLSSFSQLENTVAVNDIGRIDVIKGPDAGARYGLRGSNGALVITTK